VEEAKADTFLTHKKSIDSTMTPWKGWFQRWVADTLGEISVPTDSFDALVHAR
jgi:hypothetical protein